MIVPRPVGYSWVNYYFNLHFRVNSLFTNRILLVEDSLRIKANIPSLETSSSSQTTDLY